MSDERYRTIDPLVSTSLMYLPKCFCILKNEDLQWFRRTSPLLHHKRAIDD